MFLIESVAYELENIESKISENIAFAASESLDSDVPEFLRDLDQECSKVKKAFRHQVVSFENERLVERYFHFHQESLIDLIDTLHKGNQPGSPCLQCIIDRLSDLLNYLEEHFPEYFNRDLKMPVVYQQQIRLELESFNAMLLGKFQDANIDIGLLEILKGSITQQIETGNSLTFRQFHYLKLLRINIEGIDCMNTPDSDTFQLIKVLIHCNFNVDAYYNYMLRYIGWAVNKVQNLTEKLDQLAFFLKFANQESAMAGAAFDYRKPPINIQIADWISQEMQYLKHKQQLMPMSINAEDVAPQDFKLNFDLSVSVIAYFFRALIETGVLQNKNTSELIRFLTKYVKTKRSESISYESLRIKYYSIEDGTKDAVKKMLQSVLNFINKH